MAGIRIEEPRPRRDGAAWAEFRPPVLRWIALGPASPPERRDFGDVLAARRSAVGGPVGWDAIGRLLRHVTLEMGEPTVGRAGIVTRRRPTPSAGGLHPIRMICIDDAGGAPRLYDPDAHAFGVLDVTAEDVGASNAAAVRAILGRHAGCTVRFVADVDKVAAAYDHPASLVMREAGCLLATLCLTAEWLRLSACPLGFLGQETVGPLGFPEPRFAAVGGVQVTTPICFA